MLMALELSRSSLSKALGINFPGDQQTYTNGNCSEAETGMHC
jgi:hypothetical protein